MTSVNVASTGDVMFGSSSLTIVNRWCPPARASISTVSRGTENPTGPNHCASWSGSVKAR
jgi:hypothetical protein